MKLYDKSLTFYENGKTLTLLSLATPKFFQILFERFLLTINSAMLSNAAEEAVAATSVANQVYSLVTTALDLFAFGAAILVSLALGRGDRHAAGRITFITLLSALAFSLPVGLLLSAYAEPVLSLMNADAETLALSVRFFVIKTLYLPLTVLSATLSSLLICNAHVFISFFNAIFTGIASIAFNYLFLYTGLAIEPVVAVAMATLIVTALSVAMKLVFFILLRCPFTLGFSLSDFKNLFAYGLPGKMSLIAYTFATTITTSFIASMGKKFVNAKVYVGNITGYVHLFSDAIAGAGTILIGRFRGAKNEAFIGKLYRQNVLWACSLNVLTAILAYLFRRPLISIFTRNEEVLALTGSVMLIDIFVELFRAINMVSEQGLNACGEVKTTMLVSTISCWGISVLLAFVFGVLCKLGLVGIWLGFLSDEMARSIFYLFRWKARIRKMNACQAQ